MLNIFIDSNILFQDYFFQNKSNKSLLEFCKEDLLNIYMADVVKLELRKQYEKELRTLNSKLTQVHKENNKLGLIETMKVKKIEEQLLTFDHFYKALGKIGKFYILEAKNEILPDIITRAVERTKPFSENKSELKDAIIWLTYSKFAEVEKIDNCILLTNNTKDFCDKSDNSQVHSDLMKDTKRFKVVNSSFQFIKEHGTHLVSPEHKFQHYIDTIEIDESFVYDIIMENFYKKIEDGVHQEIDMLSPSQVLKVDYIFDGRLVPYHVEILGCKNIQCEVLGEIALISGQMDVTCETEVWEYNSVRDPDEDKYSTVGEVEIQHTLNFNFDLKSDNVYSEFEITDFSLTGIN